MWAASTESPRNIAPRQEPMITRVFRALTASGFRNAGTPLEIASTPVTAAPPDAKAWSTTYSEAPMRKPSPDPWPKETTPAP